MDMAMDYQERGALQTSTASTVSTATLDRANQVLRETRQQFIDGFKKQCDTIAALADEIVANPLSSDRAIKLLHGMAGLGGTIGFPRVSAKAGALEELLRRSPERRVDLRDGAAALDSAFTEDVAEPDLDRPSSSPDGPSMTVLL